MDGGLDRGVVLIADNEDAIFAVNLGDVEHDLVFLGGRDVDADVVGPDRQFAVAAIDKVVGKLRRNGMEVEVMAPLGAGRDLHEQRALHDKGVDLDSGEGH